MEVKIVKTENCIVASCDDKSLKNIIICWDRNPFGETDQTNVFSETQIKVNLLNKPYSIYPVCLSDDCVVDPNKANTFETVAKIYFEFLLKKNNLVLVKRDLKTLVSDINALKKETREFVEKDFELYDFYKERVRKDKEDLKRFTLEKNELRDILSNINIGKGRPSINN